MDSGLAVFILILIGIFLLFVLSGRAQKKRADDLFYQNLKNNTGGKPNKALSEDCREHLSGYYRTHRAAYSIDDITWSDLELDKIYARVDYTESAAGEEYLYWLLRTPALSEEALALSEKQIESIASSNEEMLSLKKALHGGVNCGKYSIYDYLDETDKITRKSVLSNLYAIILLAAAVVSIIFSTRVGVVIFLAVIVINVLTYYRSKALIAPYLSTLRNVLRLIECANTVCSVKCSEADTFHEEKDELRSILKELAGFRRGAFLLSFGTTSGNPLDVIFDYIRILLHLDLIKFYSMIGEMAEHHDDIDHMITLIGKIDTTISVACYRASLKTYAVPDLVLSDHGKTVFDAVDLYHPLLDDPVTNSINTEGYVLVTGSNASGKSTFLKAAALCALLSETLHTAPASSYKGSFFRIYTSMALRDDLSGGDSYYVVEIRSLKRILDAAKEESDIPILCFIDEILKGTNTVERIAASSEILRSFNGGKISCFAATHDIELTSLLEDIYHNYHFDEDFVDGDILFSYKLLDGRSTSRNAIRLLRLIGYDEQITEKAEERASLFIRTGEWKV